MPGDDSNQSSSNGEVAFVLRLVNDNQDGWGPNNQPDKYKDLPYQKFSKSDRIGKIADWTSMNHMDKKNFKYQPQFAVGNVGQYSYFHEDDESQFTLVDQFKTLKTPYHRKTRNIQSRNKTKFVNQFGKPNTGGTAMVNAKLNKQQKNQEKLKQNKNIKGKPDQRVQIKQREPSVQVKDDWKVIEEIEFSRLFKLSLPMLESPVELKQCGSLEYYDKSYDRINTKSSAAMNKLKRINRVMHKVATLDDPVIRQLAKVEDGVYTTDAIISTLMCCSRSVYPWDIIVHKLGGKIFLDKRDSNTNFDLLTVSETSGDPPQDEDKHINSPSSLALEATYINHNFSQQVLRMNEKRHSFPEPNPFIEGDEGEIASIAYKYRKWDLGEGVNLIIRSEVDAVTNGPNDESQFLSIKALNEWDPKSNGMDWRTKLDSQPGAVLATEIKNNGCKLAKWTVCALLAGVDQMKFGFVSRVNMRATDKHVILGTQQFKPNEFAAQMSLNMDNSWGIVRCIIDFLRKQEDGQYIIMKDPMKPILRIYEIPQSSFSDEEPADNDDDDDN